MGLLLLNPVINQQFLTLLKYIKRLDYNAEVPNKTPTTIHYIYRSGIIENKGNVLKLINIHFISCYYCCIHPKFLWVPFWV